MAETQQEKQSYTLTEFNQEIPLLTDDEIKIIYDNIQNITIFLTKTNLDELKSSIIEYEKEDDKKELLKKFLTKLKEKEANQAFNTKAHLEVLKKELSPPNFLDRIGSAWDNFDSGKNGFFKSISNFFGEVFSPKYKKKGFSIKEELGIFGANFGFLLTKTKIEYKKEKSFFGAVATFFGGFGSLFSGDLNIERINFEKREKEKEEKEKREKEENIKETKFKASVKIFLTILKGHNNNDDKLFQTIINNDFNILTLNTLNTLKILTNNDFNEAKDTLLKGKGKEILDDILLKKHSDYETKTIEQIFLLIYEDMGILDNIGQENILESIDVKKINKEENQKLEEKGLTIGIISSASDKNAFRFNDNVNNEILKSLGESPTKFEKEKLDNLVEFGYKIQELFTNNSDNIFQLYDVKAEILSISKIFTENKLSLSEVIKLWLITGGESDFNNLNSIKQTALYLTIMDFLENRNKDKEIGAYLTALGEKCVGTSDNKVPKGVKNIIGDTLKIAANDIKDGVINLFKTLIGATTQNSAIGIGFGALVLFGPIFTQRKSIAGILNSVTKK